MKITQRDAPVPNSFARQLVRSLLFALVLVLLPLAVGVGTFVYKARQIVGDRALALAAPLPPIPTPNPAKRTAVVLISNAGTEITDSLPPYEILAESGAFNTYFVAPERRVSPIASAQQLPLGIGRLPTGLEILPHYGFADYDRIVGRDPDLIVIPFLTDFDPERDRATLNWIREHAGPRTVVMSICAGSRVLAETGLLDGRAATGFHADLAAFAQRYPAVRWQTGLRWVDDGQIITSGTLTAGIDATLHALDRLAGRVVAERTAQALGYAHLNRLDDPALDYQPPVSPDLALLPSAMYRWDQTDVGVLLHEGVSETALAALLDTSAVNLKHVRTLAPERTFVHSRHGMIMAPRFSYAEAPALDRVIALGHPVDVGASSTADHWNRQNAGPAADILTTGAGAAFAYDAVMADIARHEGGAVARSHSINLVYPVDPAIAGGATWTPALIARPLAIGLLGLALAVLLTRRRAPRTIASPVPA
jgi:putative intracellular protease/amidase